MAQVALVKTGDRISGTSRALELLDLGAIRDKDLFLKPNFNSADAPPGSTHNDTLIALVRGLRALGASRITVGDRSGMGETRAVMQQKGIFRLAEEQGFETIVLDELEADDWEPVQPPSSHWSRGFVMALPALDADGIVQTCCLKTHRFGGHFTLSLKNSVGLVAGQVPGEGYDYMTELHSSSHQRHMIAEINTAYRTDLILLDGVEAFVEGGPDRGKRVDAQVILASTDRVAIDAVGVAILRDLGTTPEISRGPIFEQEQIARAVELSVGVQTPEQIEFITPDTDSAVYARRIQEILVQI